MAQRTLATTFSPTLTPAQLPGAFAELAAEQLEDAPEDEGLGTFARADGLTIHEDTYATRDGAEFSLFQQCEKYGPAHAARFAPHGEWLVLAVVPD